MKNLEKVLKIWNDLETSYANMKDKFDNCDRREFLFHICKYDGTNTQIDFIKSMLKKELPNYNSVELEQYSKLSNVLDAVNKVVTEENILVLEDLNDFVGYCLAKTENSSNIVRSIDDDFFDSVRVYKPVCANQKMSIEELYATTGFISSVYTTVGGSFRWYELKEKFGDILTIRNGKELRDFIELAKSSDNTFYKKVLNIIAGQLETRKFRFHQTFLNTNLFHLDGNKLTVPFMGASVIPVRNNYYGTVNNIKFLKCTSKNNYSKNEMYMVL